MKATPVTHVFEIEGMTCASCASRLQRVLEKKSAIKSAHVNYASEQAVVEFSEAPNLEALTQGVRSAGFQLALQNEGHDISGMTCGSCASRLEKVLRKTPGVLSANVDYASERAHLTRLKNYGDDTALLVHKAGFEIKKSSDLELGHASLISMLQRYLAIMIAALFVFAMGLMMLGGPEIPPFAQWALASVSQFFCGWRIYRSAFRTLRNRGANMDVLVALGTSAAYALSVYNLLLVKDADLYFESSAAVIGFVMLGKWLEEGSKKDATSATEALRELRPKTALLKRDESETAVPIGTLSKGDLIVVRSGETFAADGIVISGEALVDESILSGESVPLQKSVGDPVHSGSHNVDGHLVIRLTQSAHNSLIERMVKAVSEAQSQKPEVQKLVDRVSLIFVPLVLVIALLTLLGWGFATSDWTNALINAVAVLVVACPCALGLATPAALAASVSAFSKKQMIVRNPDAFAQAKKVKTLYIDKTGTLTHGEMRFEEVIRGTTDVDDDVILRLCAGAQAASNHPLSAAIKNELSQRALVAYEMSEAKEHRGKGVSARFKNDAITVGTRSFLEDQKVSCHAYFEAHRERLSALEHSGAGHFFIARNDEILGALVVRDRLRDDAIAFVRYMQRHHKRVVMLTGDSKVLAHKVAADVKIDEVHATLSPFDKERIVSENQLSAFVGDGVNDAQALVQASFSIAMPSSNDIAFGAADLALLEPNLTRVADAFLLAQKTTSIIKQNLGWAFIYNTLGIPLAALGGLSPMLAGAAMAFSSVSVMLNALRLLRVKDVNLEN